MFRFPGQIFRDIVFDGTPFLPVVVCGFAPWAKGEYGCQGGCFFQFGSGRQPASPLYMKQMRDHEDSAGGHPPLILDGRSNHVPLRDFPCLS